MRLLLTAGADPQINTGLNITPLMAAAGIAWASNQERASEAQVLEAVKLLVEELGADVNFVADTGETAMHAAAYRGANSVVQYLFDKGAKLDVRGQERTNAAAGRRGCRVRQFVCRPAAHGGAAAQARSEGNSVSGPVPQHDSGRGIAAQGGCTMTRQFWPSTIAATSCRWLFGQRQRATGTRRGAGAAGPRRRDRAGPSGFSAEVLLHLPQREGEIGRARAQHAGSGEREHERRGVGEGGAQGPDRGDAAGRTAAARQGGSPRAS